MGFLDKAKQKAKEYELRAKAERLAGAAEKAAKGAVHKAGDLAHDKRDSVVSGLDRAAAKVDARTEGKYSDKVTKAKTQLTRGIDKLAEQRHNDKPEPPVDPTEPEPSATDRP